MHYFNPAVETDKDILLGPIFQLEMRKASFESQSVGVLSKFQSLGEASPLKQAPAAPSASVNGEITNEQAEEFYRAITE